MTLPLAGRNPKPFWMKRSLTVGLIRFGAMQHASLRRKSA